MPELPEVERGRQMAKQALEGKRLVRVELADDPIVFDNRPAGEIRTALLGRHIQHAHRLGKQLWLELDKSPHPLFHFGMSGGFRTPNDTPLQLKTGPRETTRDWPPRFWKIILHTEDGAVLCMTDARRFGRILLRDSPLSEPPLKDLGFDALLALPSLIVLQQMLAPRRTPIKSWLLDQRGICGIGNWLADEGLFQAGLDPRRAANSLTKPEVDQLRRALSRILKRAVATSADDKRYPSTWLFHRRWGKSTGQRTSRGDPIEHLTVGGRTTAWVPNVQR
jgi:formamidopyrimidine-DNA glycosylase